jgi:hypothetical protein
MIPLPPREVIMGCIVSGDFSNKIRMAEATANRSALDGSGNREAKVVNIASRPAGHS